MPHVWPIKERITTKNLTTRPSFSNQSLFLAIYYVFISKKNGRPKNYLLKITNIRIDSLFWHAMLLSWHIQREYINRN